MKSTSILAALALTTALHAQGPLTPPGAPAPTMKSLAQIDPGTPISSAPFTISSPGSYYLTGNLSNAGPAIFITATASGATLDLRGFQVSTPSSVASTAITLQTGAEDVTVRNGSIRGVYNYGIDAGGNVRCTIESITIKGPTSNAVILGPAGRMKDCTCQSSATSNTTFAINAQEGCILENCVVRGEAATFGAGITLAKSATAIRCQVVSTNGDGFKSSGPATLEGCTSSNNVGDGYDLADGSAARDCVARENSQYGFLAASANRIDRCQSSQNTFSGYSLGSQGMIDGCSAYDNRQNGIVVTGTAHILRCMISGNDSAGITSSPASLFAPVLIDSNSILNCGGWGVSGLSSSAIITRNHMGANFSGNFTAGLTPAPIQPPATATNPFANLGS